VSATALNTRRNKHFNCNPYKHSSEVYNRPYSESISLSPCNRI